MSLATRCPACHTVFRVVQDQLRVSEGWVRCGQCQEVFNALETLFDLGDAAPEEAAVQAAAEEPTPIADEAPLDAAEVIAEGPLPEDHWDPAPPMPPMARAAPEDAPAIHLDTWQQAPAVVEAEPAAGPVPAVASTAQPQDFADLRQPGPSPALDEPFAGTDEAAAEEAEEEAAEEGPEQEPTPSRFMGPVPDWARQPSRAKRSKGSGKKSRSRPAAGEAAHALPRSSARAHRHRRKPDFVRQAERAAMWRRPAVRAMLGSAAGVLAVLLVLQVAYQYRDPLAAHAPALAPALHAGCAQIGCRIAAPRALERLRLDASDLTRTEQDQVLRFTADLHNSADFAVRAPALEVSFTDALGRVVSRKVFQPAELGLRGEAIDADAQWRIDARLGVGELRVAGYTVEVFYP
jgi:predicted Zn finger-like uncharacterized protein